MAFEKMPDDIRRDYNMCVALNKHEHFLIRCTASRYGLSLAEAVRRLIEEDNERHHYDLIEPEWARPRNQLAMESGA